MFERQWKYSDINEKNYTDTVPVHRSAREALENTEAQCLCLVVENLEEASLKGNMITHASDSTIKRV